MSENKSFLIMIKSPSAELPPLPGTNKPNQQPPPIPDGMGGHTAGDVASQAAVGALRDLEAPHSLPEFVDLVEDRLIETNNRLREIATEFIAAGSIEDLDVSCAEEIQPSPFFTSLLGPDP